MKYDVNISALIKTVYDKVGGNQGEVDRGQTIDDNRPALGGYVTANGSFAPANTVVAVSMENIALARRPRIMTVLGASFQTCRSQMVCMNFGCRRKSIKGKVSYPMWLKSPSTRPPLHQDNW